MADRWTYTSADFTEDVIESAGADAIADIDRGARQSRRPGRSGGSSSCQPCCCWRASGSWADATGGGGCLGSGVAHRLRRRGRRAVRSRLSRRGVGLIDEARWQTVGDVNPADDYAGTGRLVAARRSTSSNPSPTRSPPGSRSRASFSPSPQRSSSPRSSTGTGSRPSSAARGADRRPDGRAVQTRPILAIDARSQPRRSPTGPAASPTGGPRPPTGAAATRPPRRRAAPWPAAPRSERPDGDRCWVRVGVGVSVGVGVGFGAGTTDRNRWLSITSVPPARSTWRSRHRRPAPRPSRRPPRPNWRLR